MKPCFATSLILLVSICFGSLPGCGDPSDSLPETPTAASEYTEQPQPPAAVPELAEGEAPVTYFDSEALRQETGAVDENADKEWQTTESGLKYRVLRKGDGPRPQASDTVTVHYRGWLDNGVEFDSSYGRGESTSFPLSGVIPGWTEGMQLVGKGGMIELWIPPDLGYGASGAGGAVPPNATLHFVVELLEIQ